jgi:hypothetical protein
MTTGRIKSNSEMHVSRNPFIVDRKINTRFIVSGIPYKLNIALKKVK